MTFDTVWRHFIFYLKYPIKKSRSLITNHCLYLPEILLLKIFISLSAPPLTMIWGSAQLQHKTWSVCPFKSNKGVLQARTSHIFSKESCDPETNMWSFPWHQFTLVIHPWNKEFIKNISKMKKIRQNTTVLYCLAVDNFDFTRKIEKN